MPDNAGGQQGGSGTDAGAGGQQGGQQGGHDQAAIQRAIDAVVARERAEADRRVKDTRTELEGQLAELRKKAGKKGAGDGAEGGDEDAAFKAKVAEARKPLEDENTELKTRLAARDRRAVLADLKVLAADVSVDPAEVAERLVGQVRVDQDGNPEVVDQDGKPRYGAKGPMTLAELVKEYLAKRPYLAKSKMPSGGDFGQPAGGAGDAVDLKKEIAAAEAKGDWNKASTLKLKLLEQVGRPKS